MNANQNADTRKVHNTKIIKFRIFLLHAASLGIFFVPFNYSLLIFATLIFFIRTFAWEGGSHRYFAHRSYKTSRGFQFFLAALAASGGQRGPLWWAWHHRLHHKHSDTKLDLHSPIHRSFWYSHMGWIIENVDFDIDMVKDLSKYPELVFVNKYHYIFPYLGMAMIFCLGQYTAIFGSEVGGISAVIWGFFLTTMLSLHGTFSINSVTHRLKPRLFSYRSFKTDDASTNNWLLAIPTMGASWHNNHHQYMNSARAGFYWWEIDLTFYILKILELLGIVWDLRDITNSNKQATLNVDSRELSEKTFKKG